MTKLKHCKPNFPLFYHFGMAAALRRIGFSSVLPHMANIGRNFGDFLPFRSGSDDYFLTDERLGARARALAYSSVTSG